MTKLAAFKYSQIPSYVMGGNSLIKAETEKDLGFHIRKSLTPSVQIAEQVKTANKVFGELLRALSYRDRVHFVGLHKERVRCHLEYAVQCWNPWLQKDIEMLENVQRRAVRCIQDCMAVMPSFTC